MNALAGKGVMMISPKPRKKSLDIIQEKINNARKSGRHVVLMGLCGGASSGKTQIAAYYKKNIPGSEIIGEKGFFKNISRKRKLSAIDEPLIGDADGYSQDRKVLLTELSNPDSYDHEALIEILISLIKGEKVTVPAYDEETDNIIQDSKEIDPEKSKVIIIEGSFIFYNEKIRDMLDVKLFSEVDDDVRLSRLILKENKYLNNNPNAIKVFFIIYKKYLKPSFENYVESYKSYANIIFPNYTVNAKGEIEEDNII